MTAGSPPQIPRFTRNDRYGSADGDEADEQRRPDDAKPGKADGGVRAWAQYGYRTTAHSCHSEEPGDEESGVGGRRVSPQPQIPRSARNDGGGLGMAGLGAPMRQTKGMSNGRATMRSRARLLAGRGG